MKKITFCIALLSTNLTFAQQGGVTVHNPIFNAPAQIGGSGNKQYNYSEHRLTEDDKKVLDGMLIDIHKMHKSVGKGYFIQTEMNSNAGAMITDIEAYLKNSGYLNVGHGTGMTAAGNSNGINIYYGIPIGSQAKDSTIIINFGMLN